MLSIVLASDIGKIKAIAIFGKILSFDYNMQIIKNIIRETLLFLHLDLTKNLEYDRLTKLIFKRVIKNDSNCIDIGCHKGEILNYILKLAPQGKHFAFEPLPHLYSNLNSKFGQKATVYPYALSDKEGTSTFNFVKNAPAYSGIKQRKYDFANPEIEQITVELKTLDGLIDQGQRIDLIKIDVEGGEYAVLKGAKTLLQKNKPFIIFECGLGGSDYYGTRPHEIYHYLVSEIGLNLSTLKSFLKNDHPLTYEAFENYFNTNSEYYFVAYAGN